MENYSLISEIPVSSSTIESIGYDEFNNVLYVTFKTGSKYAYFGVSKNIWESFMSAPSKGKFLNEEIKRKGFRYKKIF